MGRQRQIHICRCGECRKNPEAHTAQVHVALNRLLLRSNEKQRRLTAAFEAARLGWGGITKISEITGLSRATIARGISELQAQLGEDLRIRDLGAGRPRVEKKRSAASAHAFTVVAGRNRGRSDERDQVEPQEYAPRQ